MDDIESAPIEVLQNLDRLLTAGEKSGVERLANAACLFFSLMIKEELKRRTGKPGKGKG